MSKWLWLLGPALWTCSLQGGSILFYAGDSANGSGVGNSAGYMAYDCFTVAAPGWEITSVFSNNQLPPIPPGNTAVGGAWEIWTDLGGATPALVASGSTATDFSWTPTGRSVPDVGLPEYTLTLYGLDVHLGGGTYWLGVSPYITGSVEAYIGGTTGQNAVGSPTGTDGLALLRLPGGALIDTGADANIADFSMGIEGTAAPEPASLFPAAAALAVLLIRRRSRPR